MPCPESSSSELYSRLCSLSKFPNIEHSCSSLLAIGFLSPVASMILSLATIACRLSVRSLYMRSGHPNQYHICCTRSQIPHQLWQYPSDWGRTTTPPCWCNHCSNSLGSWMPSSLSSTAHRLSIRISAQGQRYRPLGKLSYLFQGKQYCEVVHSSQITGSFVNHDGSKIRLSDG